MEKQPDVGDLERRKQIKVLLRQDLDITPQKYEGRTYYVVKDPVSLRYYRFKEQERFLLDLMDGDHTLEQAQKQFEQRFRPDRLTLEDLESFTSQLLQAGLAQNESPTAGRQLYDRMKKRRRQQMAQTFLNILYVKVPVFDPNKLLEKMLPPLRFIFTRWFLALSVLFMLSAIALVASRFDAFWAKLPSAREFFTVQTMAYLWVALGLVKIIHEFGHGLSCKAFGGEVHEMGLLFLVLSPCLYCNVSDSWTLPSKWKRIVISAAGIYVELIIASFATWIWYFTSSGSFANSLSMSLMVVCSVSTIVFNANPLMRFDGYYVMADWLEIPNLRDRSNKYLQNLFTEYCLGMENQPEPYMATSRKILFVGYAVVSYVYRWVVTFSILVFMYSFLKPYGLGAISYLLGTGALATMVGWPGYRLGKFLHRRGRIPDMKAPRVWSTVAVLAAIVILCCTIPLPTRVPHAVFWGHGGLAMVQIDPTQVSGIVVPERGGFLKELLVEDGQYVNKGDVLAVLDNPDLEIAYKVNMKQQKLCSEQMAEINRANAAPGIAAERLTADFISAKTKYDSYRLEERQLKEQLESLTLRAPQTGRVMRLLKKTEVGKMQEKGAPVCEVGNDQALQAITYVAPSDRQLIKKNDTGYLRIHGMGYNYWRATVVDVSSKEAEDVPQQMSQKAGGEVVTQQDPETHRERPQTQQYVVTVRIDDADPRIIQAGVMGRVKLHGEPRTLFWRLKRHMATTFNLPLQF